MNDALDGIQLWNPGDVFGDDSRLMEPGEKEVRNPAIAMAMRRIAMCEQAGTGMRMMREEWQKLGHPAPNFKNDRAWKAFEFFIPGLDKEVDMASDLMKAMFAHTDQVEAHDGAQVTPQVAPQVTTQVLQLLSVLKGAEDRDTLQRALGLKARKNFRLLYLVPALDAGLIEMTIPDKPRSSKQKYRLTDKGRQFLAMTDRGKK
jgi:hypothetical protein